MPVPIETIVLGRRGEMENAPTQSTITLAVVTATTATMVTTAFVLLLLPLDGRFIIVEVR
jgi:hypothetical protein